MNATLADAQHRYDLQQPPDRDHHEEPRTREYNIHGGRYRVSGYKDADGDTVYRVDHWAPLESRPLRSVWECLEKNLIGWKEVERVLREIFEDELGRDLFEE
jgi:hypothetical protein